MWCIWGYDQLQKVFITHQLWWVNCEFCYFHTVSLSLFSSVILLYSLNPTMSCWTTSTHFLSRWEARACSSHLQLSDNRVSHLFSISSRMESWCLVLHIVTRRNMWLLCCTSQYEHPSSLWPMLSQKKILLLTKCTPALCCSKRTLISYCFWDFQVLLYLPYFSSPTLEVLGDHSFVATRQMAKVSVPIVSSVKNPPISLGWKIWGQQQIKDL